MTTAKVSRNTVRRVLRSGETSFEYEREVQPRPKLGQWTAELDELLASNAAKAAREQLTLIRIPGTCPNSRDKNQVGGQQHLALSEFHCVTRERIHSNVPKIDIDGSLLQIFC